MLAAARSVFAEKGFVGATLDEIASLAEFGKGTLYNYFPGGKDEILFAIFDEIYDDLAQIVKDAFPGGDRRAWRSNSRLWFSDFIARCFEYFDTRSELFLILTKEAHRMCFSEHGERVSYFLGQRTRIAGALAEKVELAVDSGAMRPFPPSAVAHMLFGNISGLQMHRMLEVGVYRDEMSPSRKLSSSAEFLSSFLFDGLLLDQS